MGKYMSIVAGGAVAIFGIYGFIAWRFDLMTVLKGSVPLFMIFGGLIALIAGLSEMKDEAAAKKEKK